MAGRLVKQVGLGWNEVSSKRSWKHLILVDLWSTDDGLGEDGINLLYTCQSSGVVMMVQIRKYSRRCERQTKVDQETTRAQRVETVSLSHNAHLFKHYSRFTVVHLQLDLCDNFYKLTVHCKSFSNYNGETLAAGSGADHSKFQTQFGSHVVRSADTDWRPLHFEFEPSHFRNDIYPQRPSSKFIDHPFYHHQQPPRLYLIPGISSVNVHLRITYIRSSYAIWLH